MFELGLVSAKEVEQLDKITDVVKYTQALVKEKYVTGFVNAVKSIPGKIKNLPVAVKNVTTKITASVTKSGLSKKIVGTGERMKEISKGIKNTISQVAKHIKTEVRQMSKAIQGQGLRRNLRIILARRKQQPGK